MITKRRGTADVIGSRHEVLTEHARSFRIARNGRVFCFYRIFTGFSPAVADAFYGQIPFEILANTWHTNNWKTAYDRNQADLRIKIKLSYTFSITKFCAVWAACTTFLSACIVSGHRRVFRLQSGLTHSSNKIFVVFERLFVFFERRPVCGNETIVVVGNNGRFIRSCWSTDCRPCVRNMWELKLV